MPAEEKTGLLNKQKKPSCATSKIRTQTKLANSPQFTSMPTIGVRRILNSPLFLRRGRNLLVVSPPKTNQQLIFDCFSSFLQSIVVSLNHLTKNFISICVVGKLSSDVDKCSKWQKSLKKADGRDVRRELGHGQGFSKPDELNRLWEAIMLYTHTIYLGIHVNC